MKSCANCKNRCFSSWSGIEYCYGYEIAVNETEEKQNAENCEIFEAGIPDCLKDDPYTPSATAGDYSPSTPWNAPGMSIRDFI